MIRSKPSITYLERNYLLDAGTKADIGVGEYIGKFENAWAEYNKMTYAVSCNSGTNALYLALLALGIGEGDEVIVPSYTMVSSAWAVTYTGATPVFVDCLDDLTIDPVQLKTISLKKVKAIMPVLIYGRPVNNEVYLFARENNLFIVEDMAEAHGIMPKGDIACYSFHGSKILTTGGGGMCLTNNEVWADEMRKLCHLYLNKDMTMIHEKLAYNFRLSNIQAAVGLAQVKRVDSLLKKRDEIQFMYDDLLDKKYLMPIRTVVWVYDIDCGDKQKEIMKALKDNDIECRYGFKPMEMQPMYLYDYEKLNSYKWSKRILYLPVYPDLKESEIKRICNVINLV